MVTIHIENVIRFYDEQERSNSNHVSSITGLVGEDLGAGLLKHFFEANNRECVIYNDSVTLPRNRTI